ncbi:MAG: B12-binding domain-containing radical SAM protein [Lachnospiraceae bacterium]|nr:B12-binding domain-containing radical SAM protein [Lachnospiraceae bacterium]
MKFLLVAVNAKYIHSNPAVYSLKRFAGEYTDAVEIAEYTINNRMEDILEDIYRRKPDVIGFSCYIWNIGMVEKLMGELHKLLPKLPVFLGGPEVTYDADKLLRKYPYLTGIFIGEGEATFAQVVKYYVKKNPESLEDIPGLMLRSGMTPERKPLNLTDVPFLYDDMAPFTNRIIYYETQRGCPFRCSYCLSSIDKTVRFRDIEVVKKELAFFLEKKVKQVKFVDRTFNCNHDHAMAVWQYLYDHDNGVTNFHFEIAGDILREDEIALVAKMRPGLVQFEIGVQSTNTDTLREIRRVMDIEKLKQVVAALKAAHNVHIHLDLIAGLPYEDYDSFARSFDDVYAMEPEQLQLGFLKVLKGSYMAEMAESYGLVYTDYAPYEVLYTNWLSFTEICRLKRIEEMVEIYYNSGQFAHSLPVMIADFGQGAFAFYEALADFYEGQGFFVETPSRIYRYQALLSFAKSIHPERQELYKELLLFDLYVRENLKSRPDFAPDLHDLQPVIHAFYKREESERRYLPHLSEIPAPQLSRMTHLEPFSYSVWATDVSGVKRLPEQAFLLFDYDHRDPLTREAKVLWPENV